MDMRGRLKIPLGPIGIQREACKACCPHPEIYSCQRWGDGRDGLNWESLLLVEVRWWKANNHEGRGENGGAEDWEKTSSVVSCKFPGKSRRTVDDANERLHVGQSYTSFCQNTATAIHYGGVQLTHVLIHVQKSVWTHWDTTEGFCATSQTE